MLQRMLNRLRGVNDDEKGFTLIELLVVVLIIGILAAIALPTFLGQKDKAKDASAKSAVRNAVTQLESCLTNDPASPACAGDTDVVTARNAATSTLSAGSVTSADTWTITSGSTTGNSFTIAKNAGVVSRSCTNAGSTKGGCTTNNGSW